MIPADVLILLAALLPLVVLTAAATTPEDRQRMADALVRSWRP